MTGFTIRPVPIDARKVSRAVETLRSAAASLERSIEVATVANDGFLARLGTGGTISGALDDAVRGMDKVQRLASTIGMDTNQMLLLDSVRDSAQAARQLSGAARVKATLALDAAEPTAPTTLRTLADDIAAPKPPGMVRLAPFPSGVADQALVDHWNGISIDLMSQPRTTVDVAELRGAYERIAAAAGRKYGHDPVAPPSWLRDAPATGPIEVSDGQVASLSIQQQLADPERLLDRFTAQLRDVERQRYGFDLARAMANGFDHIDGAKPFDIPSNVFTDDAAAEQWSWAMRTQRSRDLLTTLDRSKPFAALSAVLHDGDDAQHMSRMRGATKVARELVDQMPATTDPARAKAINELRSTLDELLPAMDRDQYPEYGAYGRAIATADLLASVERATPPAAGMAPAGTAGTKLTW